VRHRGHFPTEQAALKVLYLVATERRKNRPNPTGSVHGWKQILNALTIHYGDRITAAALPTSHRAQLHNASDSPLWASDSSGTAQGPPAPARVCSRPKQSL
jgi:hypothetical protein